MQYLDEFNLENKNILLRLDLNTPIQEGRISNDERIIRSMKTIRYILDNKGRLKILSHLGRPLENGIIQKEFSLEPVAKRLGELLNREIKLINSLDDNFTPLPGEVVLIENIRFCLGEKSNDETLSSKLAKMCDIFIMDAFATSHRAHASTTGVISKADEACGGFLLKEELFSLNQLHQNNNHPSIAILGGSKISTKLDLINSLANKMDHIILGGGIANTCLAAQGYEIGKSLFEEDMIVQARELSDKENVLLPSKVIVSDSVEGKGRVSDIGSIQANEAIFDIAPESFADLNVIFDKAKVILWNGPVGLFEFEEFISGTKAITDLIVKSEGYSVGGGGDTIAAAEKLGVLSSLDYISTAGGAFLEYMEGKRLPAIEALEAKALVSTSNQA
ncbi:MAG: phosphoglycerate kinase [SAR86 cluster bacterium]|jgi:phosphoglycerate kinase|nr:phosphoglycerate kinase [SAR86 cluster bacterium]